MHLECYLKSGPSISNDRLVMNKYEMEEKFENIVNHELQSNFYKEKIVLKSLYSNGLIAKKDLSRLIQALKPDKMRIVNLKNIDMVDVKILRHLDAQKLISLSLKSCQDFELHQRLFSNKSLSSSESRNIFISFSNLTCLTIKDIYYPLNLHVNFFYSLESLKKLSINNCRFDETIKVSCFNGRSSLQELNLSHNRLKLLGSEMLSGLDRLERLDLSYNEFDDIDPDVFGFVSNLTYLNLSYNRG